MVGIVAIVKSRVVDCSVRAIGESGRCACCDVDVGCRSADCRNAATTRKDRLGVCHIAVKDDQVHAAVHRCRDSGEVGHVFGSEVTVAGVYDIERVERGELSRVRNRYVNSGVAVVCDLVDLACNALAVRHGVVTNRRHDSTFCSLKSYNRSEMW